MKKEPSAPPPVGIKILAGAKEHAAAPIYQGVSYCDALRCAGQGATLRVLPGSIQVCRWSPVILGLKQAQGRFEESLAPRLEHPIAGLLLAPLDRFPGQPQVVVLRAEPGALREMLQSNPRLWGGHDDRLDRSALPLLTNPHASPRQGLIGGVNRALAALARFRRWQALTQRLFRNRFVTASFEALISRALADMSMCRNSTVIPLQTGCVNVSFFCTGGITWGRNSARHLTSGWPWSQFQHLCKQRPRSLAGENND
jgi:uncharacterized protein (DUF169 family)